jgi:tRNA pseudouridine38-40 synthase
MPRRRHDPIRAGADVPAGDTQTAVKRPTAPPDPAADKLKFKLTIAYDGGRYAGWQTQQTGTGVQQLVEEALGHLFPSHPAVHGSSRTDTGVHALGLVAHFEVPRAERPLSAPKLLLAVNAWLPDDIRVLAVKLARPAFHARFSASGKQYRYHVWNHPVLNPLLRHQAWHVRRKLDLAPMQAAARHFVGRLDFRSFRANPDYDTDSTVRALTRCEVRRRGQLFTFIIEGDGFLYKMCRGIVGTLVQVGEGRLQPADIPRILASRDRRVAGTNAPAHGLVLAKVFYRKHAHRPG